MCNDDYDYAGYEEDRNFTLPNEFITNFDLSQLPIYKEAAVKSNIEGLVVEETDCDGKSGTGSLWFFGVRSDLSDFWRLFEQIKSRAKLQ